MKETVPEWLDCGDLRIVTVASITVQCGVVSPGALVVRRRDTGLRSRLLPSPLQFSYSHRGGELCYSAPREHRRHSLLSLLDHQGLLCGTK